MRRASRPITKNGRKLSGVADPGSETFYKYDCGCRALGASCVAAVKITNPWEENMRYPIAMLVFCTMFTMATGHAQAQQAQFPLAAPAGKDSDARQVAPPGAVNQGPFDRLDVEIRHRVHAARRRENLEPGEDQADAGRQARRRHRRGVVGTQALIARWRMPATISSGPKCSMRALVGQKYGARGKPVRMPKRFPACASRTPTSARSSMRSTAARSCSSCRPSIRSRKRAKR